MISEAEGLDTARSLPFESNVQRSKHRTGSNGVKGKMGNESLSVERNVYRVAVFL